MTSVLISSNSLFYQYVNPSLTTRTTFPSPDLTPLGPVRNSPIPDLRTNRAISSPEAFNPLHNVSAIDQELDRVILQNKKDALKNQEFSAILDEVFENITPLTLELCSNMIVSSRRARKLQLSVKSALDSFQEQHYADEDGNFKRFSRCFLDNFWMAAHPFPVDHFRAFNRVYSKQIAMMARLESQRMKLDGKSRGLVAWRKVSNGIFVAAFCSVLIGSVASVYVKASAGLTALIAAVTVPIGSIGRWLNLTWKKAEGNCGDLKDIITVTQIGSDIVFQELGCIAALVERFQIETEELLMYANLTTCEDDAGLVIAMDEIKRKVDDAVKTIHDLSVQAYKCTQETKRARALILHRISMNHPAG